MDYKLAGYRNTNLFVKSLKDQTLAELWTSQICPLVSMLNSEGHFRGDEQHFIQLYELSELLNLGAVYVEGARTQEDSIGIQGKTLRFHLMPKRYAMNISIPALILGQTSDYLVINKPAGIPCHPTVDNKVENVLSFLEVHLGTRLFPVHRLDQDTSGLWIVARSSLSAGRFESQFRSHNIKKYYRAIVALKAPVLGLHRHWMDPTPKSPRVVSEIEQSGWKECRLKVLHVKAVGSFDDLFEVWIELETGRTHQIRVQMSKIGSPLLGDTLYSELKSHKVNDSGSFRLHCEKIEFQNLNGDIQIYELAPGSDFYGGLI